MSCFLLFGWLVDGWVDPFLLQILSQSNESLACFACWDIPGPPKVLSEGFVLGVGRIVLYNPKTGL